MNFHLIRWLWLTYFSLRPICTLLSARTRRFICSSITFIRPTSNRTTLFAISSPLTHRPKSVSISHQASSHDRTRATAAPSSVRQCQSTSTHRPTTTNRRTIAKEEARTAKQGRDSKTSGRSSRKGGSVSQASKDQDSSSIVRWRGNGGDRERRLSRHDRK